MAFSACFHYGLPLCSSELFMVMNPYCHILFSSVCPRKGPFLAVSLTSPHEYLLCCIFGLAESTLWSFYKVYSVFFYNNPTRQVLVILIFNDVKTEVQEKLRNWIIKSIEMRLICFSVCSLFLDQNLKCTEFKHTATILPIQQLNGLLY